MFMSVTLSISVHDCGNVSGRVRVHVRDRVSVRDCTRYISCLFPLSFQSRPVPVAGTVTIYLNVSRSAWPRVRSLWLCLCITTPMSVPVSMCVSVFVTMSVSVSVVPVFMAMPVSVAVSEAVLVAMPVSGPCPCPCLCPSSCSCWIDKSRMLFELVFPMCAIILRTFLYVCENVLVIFLVFFFKVSNSCIFWISKRGGKFSLATSAHTMGVQTIFSNFFLWLKKFGPIPPKYATG